MWLDFHPLDCDDDYVSAGSSLDPSLACAWLFAERAVCLFDRLVQEHQCTDFLQPVNMNDIIALEKFFALQESFVGAGKSSVVDIGYHYTKRIHLRSILENGLLTKGERDAQHIVSKFNGSAHGEGMFDLLLDPSHARNYFTQPIHSDFTGIYTADDPGAFFNQPRYGDIGVLVLRLKGKAMPRWSGGRMPEDQMDSYLDRAEPMHSMVVLRQSSQCVPILWFDKSKIDRLNPSCLATLMLQQFDRSIRQIVANLLNTNTESPAPPPEEPPVLTNTLRQETRGAPQPYLGTLSYTKPVKLTAKTPLPGYTYTLLVSPTDTTECSICLCSPNASTSVQLNDCGHTYHLDCIRRAVACKSQCPNCRHPIDHPTPSGHMPSGTMRVQRDALLSCAGHAWGSLLITYNLVAGVQADYHPNPRRSYPSISRTTYLPDTPAGRRLLSRLQDAFRYGLTFRIGTSLTTGRNDVITWASIPHKTSPRGGGHGFPNPNYFRNCHAALDALHVRPGILDNFLIAEKRWKYANATGS